MSAGMVRLRFTVKGRVQGVGFRAATVAAAERSGVTGWVRNRSDGAVEGEAQGDGAGLDAFVAFLRTGPRYAHVAEVTTEARAAVTGEPRFSVR